MSDWGNRVFNMFDACVALLTQPTLLAHDVAACACVNKTAARAARTAGWRALLERTLPHATGRDAVATLRAYQQAARSASIEENEEVIMCTRLIVTVRREDGSPLFTESLSLTAGVRDTVELPFKEVTLTQAVSAVLDFGKLTASLFLEQPDGRGGTRVACIFNERSVAQTFDVSNCKRGSAVPATVRRYGDELDAYKWQRVLANGLLRERGSNGRVLVFSNAALDDAPSALDFYMYDDEFLLSHTGWFALLIHVPAEGGARRLTVCPQATIMHFGFNYDGEQNKLVTEKMGKRELRLMLGNLQWREC